MGAIGCLLVTLPIIHGLNEKLEDEYNQHLILEVELAQVKETHEKDIADVRLDVLAHKTVLYEFIQACVDGEKMEIAEQVYICYRSYDI